MSIKWIRNVIIDEEKTTIEIQIGNRRIGDKCYTRISNEIEAYFKNTSDTRDGIVMQGIEILKRKILKRSIQYPDGREYDWL